jgi:hypothetical protein
MSPRTLLASGAIALTIAGIGYASHPDEIAPPRCAPVTEKVVRCFIPTEGRTAVAYLEAFEDGSVTPWTLDPDSRNWERNTSIGQDPSAVTYWTGHKPSFIGK